MADHVEEFIFCGDDIKIERFPSDTQFIYANPPLRPVASYQEEIARALDAPYNAMPLEKQLDENSHVTIAFDDPCLPVPLMLRDIRGIVIEKLIQRLYKIGVKKDHIRLICANGLHRKWTIKELSRVLGKKVVSEMGPERISCHDATKGDELVYLGTTENGYEVEINKAVVESDITIYVNVNFTSMNGGHKSILVGLGSWRSIRHHHTPLQWNADQSVMNPQTNPMHGILREMGVLVHKKCNIFQIESVINNKIWPWPFDEMLKPLHNGSGTSVPGAVLKTSLSLASYSPRAVKRFVRNNLIRSDYRLCGIFAGDVDDVHKNTLEMLYRQQNVTVDEQADILILGVPNLSPYSALSVFNPILLRSLTLGYLMGLYKNRPLVKKDGIIVAYNPGIQKFHPGHHPSYVDFWHRDLEEHYDPIQCWEELAEPYAENPLYKRLYQDSYAYHGTHALINWIWSGMCMKHLKGVVLAGAKEPETARKIGFMPAPDFSTALSMAKEMAGVHSKMAYQFIPPLFCVDMK
jgi:nickel-dependent lactate racemase